MITLETELVRIRGLSQGFISKLAKLNIRTVSDLLFHFPTRYDDFSKIIPIADLSMKQAATIRGVIRKVELKRTWKKRMVLVEATVTDDTGGIKAIWFNQPYIAKILRPGLAANFSGKIAYGEGEIYLSNPAYEPLRGSAETAHTGRLVPVYPETRGLTSRGIRYLLRPILKVIPPIQEFIPREALAANRLPEVNAALRDIHFPRRIEDADSARERFAFEDLFLFQLANMRMRSALAKEQAHPIRIDPNDLKMLIETLPFKLTPSQGKSLEEILAAISEGRPMNRLLQGDVGSGKTVVAAIAALSAAKAGLQAAFMAPTEVLARQHYETLNKLFGGVLGEWGIEIGLLLSGLGQKAKNEVTEKISNGEIKIIIGTHALIQKTVKFKKLSLAVIDEQHRFGVKQRAHLVGGEELNSNNGHKHSELPHFLSMSATPIPRTLSLTLFGDLDISIIGELPKGRGSILTKVVSPENRAKAHVFVREQIKKGRQAFVICPRIEANSEAQITNNASYGNDARFAIRTSQNRTAEVKAVKAEHERLSKEVFPDLKVGMMHGKLGAKEKEHVMREFKEGMLDLLVATSVVEVGIDVPNATVMIIEGADRFGLAQLYQFRGRIGRGEHQSFCFLFTDSSGQATQERLNALLAAKNGFELAEFDLKIRGPGEFLGDKQTGLPDIAMKALANMELVKASRDAAEKILTRDPEFKQTPLLKEKLSSFQRSIHLE